MDTLGLIPAHAGKTWYRHRDRLDQQAHPRSRGENKKSSGPMKNTSGSSPLTRGKLVAVDGDVAGVGLIPAHAGKTELADMYYSGQPAHPRSRGENWTTVMFAQAMSGSSPLTRGKRRLIRTGIRQRRLIPAHAGKTMRRCVACVEYQAHPRSRGENAHRSPPLPESSGSSPLTRGKRWARTCQGNERRLIPAHAGKTRGWIVRGCPPGAHPRSRGENTRSRAPASRWAGSSPLTRGKLYEQHATGVRRRLIPAHAGKTGHSPDRRLHPWAHPRSRGENFLIVEVAEKLDGSSPLTRGKPDAEALKQFVTRLIPAHAGKTPCGSAAAKTLAAHPRSRGENTWAACHFARRPGSSPLTRGKHFLTCAFTAQIDQILETLELAVSSGSYSVWVACATDAPQDQVRSIGLVLPSSRASSSGSDHQSQQVSRDHPTSGRRVPARCAHERP